MKKVTYLGLTCAIICAVLSASIAHAAMVATSDQSRGYSNSVLDAVVKRWHPPMDGKERTIRIIVMIDGNGLVEQCSSANKAKSGAEAADQAACAAVRSIGQFPKPPYGLPMDVFLSFWVSKSEVTLAGTPFAETPATAPSTATPVVAAPIVTQAPAQPAPSPATPATPAAPTEDSLTMPKSSTAPAANTTHKPTIQENRGGAVLDEKDYYVKMVMRKIGPNVEFPPNLPSGELSTSLTVQVDGKGNILDVTASKSSGTPELDEALVKATQKTGKVNAPPDNKPRELFLTFIIKNL